LVYSAGGGYLRLSPWTVEPYPLPAVHWTSVTRRRRPAGSGWPGAGAARAARGNPDGGSRGPGPGRVVLWRIPAENL